MSGVSEKGWETHFNGQVGGGAEDGRGWAQELWMLAEVFAFARQASVISGQGNIGYKYHFEKG